MSPKIQLYMSPGTCALAPHIVLRESDLPFIATPLSMPFPEEYRHLNPKARVPILELSTSSAPEIITETTAIMTAISQLAPSKHLLGKTDLEVVRSYEWMVWISGTLHGQGFGGLFRPERYIDDEAALDAVKAQARENLKGFYEFIDERLEGRNNAVGDEFTAVDAYLFVFYRWGNVNRFGMRENYPNYTRVVEKLCMRQSVVDAVREEGIEMFGEVVKAGEGW